MNDNLLNWIGNKTNSIDFILDNLPKNFNNYYEPFIGSGVIYFNLLKPDVSTISDLNYELINLYKIIQKDVEKLIENLFFYKIDQDTFEYLKNLDRNKDFVNLCPILRATRFLYINLNSKEKYYKTNKLNECINRFQKNKIKENIIDILEYYNNYLKNTKIEHFSYDAILNLVQPNDLVYLDPPYHNCTFKFNYNTTPFDFTDQYDLKLFCDKLNEKGVYFMQSNYFNNDIRLLYMEYNQLKKIFPYKKQPEILIKNF